MSTTIFTRSTLRTAGMAAVASASAYAGLVYYQRRSIVHAESLPSDAQAGIKKMTWSGFTELRLESAEMVNHNVKRLTFALPDSETISGISPITSLLSKHTPEGAWLPVIRPYTPVSSANDPGHVTFMIKRYPNGKGSGKMHSLVPGDKMAFKPLHEFDYKPNQYASMTLIAGGSGITPIYQLTKAILDDPHDRTKLTLIYANNTTSDILQRQELDALAARFPDRLRTVYTVTKPATVPESNLHVGYVTKDLLLKSGTLTKLKGEKLPVKVLVSGPPAMVEAIAGAKGGFGWTQGTLGGILKDLGYDKEDVHKF